LFPVQRGQPAQQEQEALLDRLVELVRLVERGCAERRGQQVQLALEGPRVQQALQVRQDEPEQQVQQVQAASQISLLRLQSRAVQSPLPGR
jgi:hypothetical protein